MGSSAKWTTSERGLFITDSNSESRESSLSSSTVEGSSMDDVKAVASPLGWPIRKTTKALSSSDEGDEKKSPIDDSKLKNLGSKVSDTDMMKERYAKLLLGEDMSGSGKGVSTALAISNAITNLCASVFGQLWRLEPLAEEKKTMWRREMELLLCVSDHIVELIPSWQTFPDGSKLEVMTCRPRSDLFINLPALRKLDKMLLEILDSFNIKEFWYVDQGIIASSDTADGSASYGKTMQRQEEKWWLPVPRVPSGGLSESSRKQLAHTRECTNQILKAAMSINSIALSDMELPDSYLDSLPKSGRASLGDVIYRYITSDQFSAECLLDCLDLSSEHVALEIANRTEASIYIWRRRASHPNTHRSTTKSSWEMVKDLMMDGDKKGEMLAERAEGLLMSLKQRFPALTQTTLDTTKIQCNKDVGKSILESYSRVLESLAFNIVARIDDLLYVDDLTKQSDRRLSLAVPTVGVIANKKLPNLPYPAPASSSPYKSTLSNPSFSPAVSLVVSPFKAERTTPFIGNNHHHHNNNNDKPPRRGLGVKRALTSYLGVDTKPKICSS